MTESDIIRIAKLANGEPAWDGGVDWYWDELERFAALVAAAEREACAQVCDAYGMPDGTSETARILAATIRARWQYD